MKHNNSWHLLENDQVLHELSTDMYKGLTTEEAKRRKHNNGENSVWHIKHTPAKEVAVATLFDLATLLLIISAITAAVVDKSYEAGVIVMILIIGAALRTAAYVRANRILEGIAKEKIPVSSVIRDGRIKVLSAEEIVVGDVIFLEEGDTVPCDGRVVSGEDSVVSENGITENSSPVHKFNTVIRTEAGSGDVPCEFRSNMLYAGSIVLSGAVRIVATACGEDALISMKQGGIVIDPESTIPVVEKLKNRSRNTSLVMLACVMILTALSIFFGEGFTLPDVFLGTMAMAAAAMSEFLTAIGYIIVAVAIRDTAVGGNHKIKGHGASVSKNISHAVIREAAKLEDIATPDTVIFCGSTFFRSGRAEILAYRTKYGYSDYRDPSTQMKSKPAELLTLALSATAGVNTGMTVGGESNKRMSAMAGIVYRAADAYSRKVQKPLEYSYSPIDHSDSSRENSDGLDTSTILIGKEVWAVSCGAINSVLKCCSAIETEDGTEPLTDDTIHKIYKEVAKLEFVGAQVVAVAKRKTAYTTLDKPALVTQYMTFVGFFAVAQEQEKEADTNATEAIDYLLKNGVRPVLFTETPEADLYYCHRLGLFNKRTIMVEYKDLSKLDLTNLDSNGLIVSFADLKNAYLSVAYSRAVRYISKELKKYADSENGDKPATVSVVGREVWDSGAIMRADNGYAVVRSKYRNVPESLLKNAQVVVDTSEKQSESGYGGVIGVTRGIKAARRIIYNTGAAKNYLTISQCARLIVLLSAVLLGTPLISAVFILLWGLIFDFVAVLVMSFEQGNGKLFDQTRKNAWFAVLTGVLWGTVTSASIPLLQWIADLMGMADGLTSEVKLGVLCGSIIISGVVISAEILKSGSIFKLKQINVAQFLFAVVSLGFSAFVLFTDVGAGVVGAEVSGIFGVFAPIPGLVLLLIIEIGKLIVRKDKKRLAKG